MGQTAGMISVHILYPRTDDSSTFDMSYYTSTHMPMLAQALGDACKGWGASGVKAGPWQAVGWATIESQEAFDTAMAEHGAAIMADVANYTNVAPQLVIGDVAH
jgi:uncharacterized protein (TIGR02118 family)